jgi:hypothetical protein
MLVLGQAVHRVVAEGISSEQEVGEAIARIKQILAETVVRKGWYPQENAGLKEHIAMGGLFI